jgi:hypothetical protein
MHSNEPLSNHVIIITAGVYNNINSQLALMKCQTPSAFVQTISKQYKMSNTQAKTILQGRQQSYHRENDSQISSCIMIRYQVGERFQTRFHTASIKAAKMKRRYINFTINHQLTLSPDPLAKGWWDEPPRKVYKIIGLSLT